MHKGQNASGKTQGNGEGQNAVPQGQDGMNRNRYGGAQETGGKHQGAGRYRPAAGQRPGQGANPDAGTQRNPYYNDNAQTNFYDDPAQTGPSNRSLLGSINTGQLLTGALIGAAAAYVLSSEEIQKKLFKGIAAMGDIVSGGLDEIKERYEDAKAEYEAGKGA